LKVKIERSGGFAGIISSSELITDKLPPSFEVTVRELLSPKKSLQSLNPGPRSGSADYLNYKITIQNGMKKRVLKCNELGMDSKLKSLVKYVENNPSTK